MARQHIPAYPFAQWSDRSLAIAAGCFLCGFLGAIVGLVYGWSYTFDRVWFYLWLAAALYFWGRRGWRWWQDRMQAANTTSEGPAPDRATRRDGQSDGGA